MSETIWDAYDDLAASLNRALLLLQDMEEELRDGSPDTSMLHGRVEQFLTDFGRVRK